MDDTSTINESMEKSLTTDKTSTIRQGMLNAIRILKGIKYERARKILEIIEESDSVSLGSSKGLKNIRVNYGYEQNNREATAATK